MGGQPVAQAPRTVLKRHLAAAADQGLEMKTGVECEFFLLDADAHAVADTADRAAKSCYDQGALMPRYDIISEICDAMQALGWGPYQNAHEDANGQFEMNWDCAGALVTADRHGFCKRNGQVDRIEPWLAGDLHAETLCQPHGVRLSRPCLPLAGRAEPVR